MVVHDLDRIAGRSARSLARRRRRQVLQGLMAVTSLAGAGALLAGGVFVGLLVAALLALAAYVLLLVHLRSSQQHRSRVVRLDAADAPRARPISASRVADRIA